MWGRTGSKGLTNFWFEPDCLDVSISLKRLVFLAIVHLVAHNSENKRLAVGEDEIADRLEIPVRLAREILFEFVDSGLFKEVKDKGRECPVTGLPLILGGLQ